MHFMIDAKTTTDFSAITDAFYIIFSACKPYARNMQLLITIFFSFFQTIFPDQAPRTCTWLKSTIFILCVNNINIYLLRQYPWNRVLCKHFYDDMCKHSYLLCNNLSQSLPNDMLSMLTFIKFTTILEKLSLALVPLVAFLYKTITCNRNSDTKCRVVESFKFSSCKNF